jgi:ubiquinol-cytochrome c reductase cytochrome b subunit
MSHTTSTGAEPGHARVSRAAAIGIGLDERLGVARIAKKGLRKVFPDHWSFMLGEIALYSFLVLLLSGTFLTLWFKPSMGEVLYDGGYVPLKGIEMSEAYRSTLELSFDVRGGLVMRQIHHWAALLFVVSLTVHMFRIFFTGAFRRPRETNWIIGAVLLLLGLGAGFTGYSLPDDLLSGTGLRIIEGLLQGFPVIGSYVSFFLFNGGFPGTDIIPRLFIIHVLLIPGIILALITVHLMLVLFHKHTQYPGPGRTETNVVGFPLMPVYIAKAGGFFFVVFGVIALMSAFVTINPIWAYGPYTPTQVSAGSQPDWYIGFLEGALRAMPGFETVVFGYVIPWNVLVPGVILPGILVTALIAYPFIEEWITGDRREHHLLDRPRNQPVRTGIGVMAIVFYGILTANGGNDIIAFTFDMSLNAITWATRILLIVAPPVAFVITKRICLGLQRRDRDKVLHGRETGIIRRLPHGEFIEVHEPISAEERYMLTSGPVYRPVELGPETDENGIPRPGGRAHRLRVRLSSFYFQERVEPPTPAEVHELEAAHGDGHH